MNNNIQYKFMSEQEKKQYRKNFFCENKEIILDIIGEIMQLIAKKVIILAPAVWIIKSVLKSIADLYCGDYNNNNNEK